MATRRRSIEFTPASKQPNLGQGRFTVSAYTSDDIVFAKRLVDAGSVGGHAARRPIGSGWHSEEANLRSSAK